MQLPSLRPAAQLDAVYCHLLLLMLHTAVSSSESGCSAICGKSDAPLESQPSCLPLPKDCVPTNAPCYCSCPVCLRKVGEPCSETNPLCEDHLVCLDGNGREKEEIYWWSIFHGGTCQPRPSGRREFNDTSRIVTYVFIIVAVAVLLISLSYIGYIFFRNKSNPDGTTVTIRSYDTTAAELLLSFFGRFGKTTERAQQAGHQLRPEQCELQHCAVSDHVQELSEVQEVLIDASCAPPPPYSGEHFSHCVTGFTGLTLPEYSELQPHSSPPSYDNIHEIGQ